MSERIKLKCPKCKGQNLFVVTIGTESVGFDVVNGVVVSRYTTGDVPEVLRSDGKCYDCDHQWRLRYADGWADPASQEQQP